MLEHIAACGFVMAGYGPIGVKLACLFAFRVMAGNVASGQFLVPANSRHGKLPSGQTLVTASSPQGKLSSWQALVRASSRQGKLSSEQALVRANSRQGRPCAGHLRTIDRAATPADTSERCGKMGGHDGMLRVASTDHAAKAEPPQRDARAKTSWILPLTFADACFAEHDGNSSAHHRPTHRRAPPLYDVWQVCIASPVVRMFLRHRRNTTLLFVDMRTREDV